MWEMFYFFPHREKTILWQKRDIKYWHQHHDERVFMAIHLKRTTGKKPIFSPRDTRVTHFTAHGGRVSVQKSMKKRETFTSHHYFRQHFTWAAWPCSACSQGHHLSSLALFLLSGSYSGSSFEQLDLLLALRVILRVIIPPSLLASIVHLLVPVRVGWVKPWTLFHTACPEWGYWRGECAVR